MTDQRSENEVQSWRYSTSDTQPSEANLYVPAHATYEMPVTAPPVAPVPPAPPARRGPGWGGVVVVSLIAAVAASALTAGGMRAFDRRSAASAPVAASSTSTPAPVLVAPSGTSGVPDWVAVSAAVEPSVVSVRVDLGNGSGDEGSGLILDTQGHVLTNNHVIADATGGGATLTVALSDGRIYPASVVGADSSTDLAVLKLTTAPSDLKPVTFGDSSAVKVGDAVMAIGNPLGLADTATTGIVSALNRPVSTSTSQSQQQQQQQQQDPFGLGNSTPQAEQVVTSAIQTDAAVNPGNSGGALVNSGGQVIGVTSSIASLDSSGSGESGNIGLGFAIPGNEAKDVANQLLTTGTVKHAYLGVTIGDGTATVNGAQMQAAIIGTVGSGTPAAAAGLKANDAVVALNGQKLDGADSLIGQIRALDPGTKVTLTVVRAGQSQTITVTLAANPNPTH